MELLDYKSIKKDFPILGKPMNDRPLSFLDSGASSQQPESVIRAYADYHRTTHANIHRGAYILSYQSTELYDKTREKVARFINSPCVECCIFTRNTTESINLVATSWGDRNIQEGDEILVSEMEHHANLVPWMMLAERKKAVLKHIPLTDDFKYDYERLDEVISPRTKIIAVAHVSNSVGTIHDLKRIGEAAKKAGAVFLVDGAQGAPHAKVDVQEIGCDFYALSAHKMLGPTGVGVLYGKKELLESMPPYQGGGDMILTVWKDGFTPAPLPEKFEAGTPNIAGVIAFAAAIEYIEQIGIERFHGHEICLLEEAIERISLIDGVTLYGTSDFEHRGGILSFNVDGVHTHDVGGILDAEGVAVRAGHHCNEPFMKKLGLPMGTVRASFYIYNGPEDVDALVQGVMRVKEVFGSVLKR